jgi:6-pyruvoyltetrahydropterin/6-carboxytetrahydropterin synthase
MFTLTRSYDISAAHRLEGHPKCGRMHGHNYTVEVTLVSEYLDDQGMLLDFGRLDQIAKPIIEELDHRYIVSQTNEAANDPYVEIAKKLGHAVILQIHAATAECIADYLAKEIKMGLEIAEPRTHETLYHLSVTVWETRRSSATGHA